MMDFIPAFALSVLALAEGSGQSRARMRMIVRRPYAYLESRLRKAFEGRVDVEIFVDRRRGERRAGARPIQEERRRAERRMTKEEVVEIVIEGDPLAMFGTTSQR
jgi:hypothetical protein